MDWERPVTLYDESAQKMKPLSTVDQYQIFDLEQQLKTPNFDRWLPSELSRRTEPDDERRPASNHAGLLATSVTNAASIQLPIDTDMKPVVPLVVEAKEAEDDEMEGDVRVPTRRRGDRIPATSTSFTSASSSSRQPIHQPSYAPFNAAPFGGNGGVLTTTIGGGGGAFHQPSFIPLSVCNPKDEPQTVPCVADASLPDTRKQERKRERNRLAAQKCRQRKVEQIGMLQDRVQKLSRTKVELERTVDDLRRHIDLLHRHLRQHVSAGCQLACRTSASTFSL